MRNNNPYWLDGEQGPEGFLLFIICFTLFVSGLYYFSRVFEIPTRINLTATPNAPLNKLEHYVDKDLGIICYTMDRGHRTFSCVKYEKELVK